jgi:hypothetical protein
MGPFHLNRALMHEKSLFAWLAPKAAWPKTKQATATASYEHTCSAESVVQQHDSPGSLCPQRAIVVDGLRTDS